MKKIWVNKTNSFEEAERFDEEYYLEMTESERLATMQFLRESYLKIKGDEGREGLRRFVKIVK